MNLLLRIEQRISFDDLLEDNDVRFDVRFRLRLSGRYEFAKKVPTRYWFLPYGIELFVPVENNLTDFIQEKSRMRTGLGFNFNKHWRYVFLLNLELDGGFLDTERTVDHLAFEFRLRHTIPWDEQN